MIPGSGTDYINLRKSRLEVKCNITKPDGSSAGSNLVGPINLTLHSLFQQVEVIVGDKNITASVGPNHSFKALIDILFTRGESLKTTKLEAELFAKDTGTLDGVPPSNQGSLMERTKYFNGSNVVQLEGPLRIDAAHQDKLLLNGVPITFRFSPSPDKLVLMHKADTPYKMNILDARLKICTLKVNPVMLLAHDQALEESDVVYAYWKSHVKSLTIPSGVSSFLAEDVFNGERPGRLIIGFINNKGYAGSPVMNPNGISKLDFTVNSTSVPHVPFRPDMSQGFLPQHF